MNNKQIAVLCVAVFLIGDAEAIVRANRRIKKLSKKNDILQMKVNVLTEFAHDVFDGNDLEEAASKLNETAVFINIVDYEN